MSEASQTGNSAVIEDLLEPVKFVSCEIGSRINELLPQIHGLPPAISPEPNRHPRIRRGFRH